MKIRVGTCGWVFDDWKGTFYPAGTDDELVYYATVFSAVEIDSTWYRIPSRKTVESWHRRSPDGFTFCPKLPGDITHESLLEDAGEQVRVFLDVISGLGDRLGPILVQLSPHFPAERLGTLEQFVTSLPRELRYAVELRHKSWLGEPAVLELLGSLSIAVVMADHPWYPRFEQATCDFVYLRLLGRRNVYPDFTGIHRQRNRDLAHWVHVLTSLPSWVERAYVFANNQFEGHSPETVRKLVEILGDRVVPAPGRLPGGDAPPTLFDQAT